MESPQHHEETGIEALARLGSDACLLKIGDSDIDHFVRKCGGLLPCELTEIVGNTASGKSQFCLSLIASFLCDESKAGYNVAVVDTNGSFRPSRLLQILREKWGVTSDRAEALLSRVFIRRGCDSADLNLILKDLLKKVEDSRIDLVIVDSIGSALSDTLNDYLSSGLNIQLAVLGILKQMANLGCWVLTVNHLVYWRSSPTPALGRRWINEIANRILITADENMPDIHWIQVFPRRKINEDRAPIQLTASGVTSHSEATQLEIPPHSQIMDSFLIDVDIEEV